MSHRNPTPWPGIPRFLLVVLIAFAVAVPAVADEPSTNAGYEGPRTLVIGKISDNPRRDFQGLQPLVDYVVSQLGDVGITEGKVLVGRDHRQMLSYLRQGKVDWLTETVGLSLLLRARAQAQIVARRWKFGEPDYHTTVFVRADSEVLSLADLRGRTVAFEHPGSSTGFLIPAVEIRRHELPLVLMGTPRERPSPDMVGYFFSGDEVNTSTWVHKGLVDAGAISNTDWTRPDQVPPAFKADLRIIYEGQPLPRALELFREGLDPVLADRLLEVLVTAHENEQGREVLSRFQQTSRFDRYEESDWEYIEGLWEDIEALLSDVN